MELFRISPNYFSFLGGVFIAASVNIYTSIFVSDTLPAKWILLLVACCLLFVSGFFWTKLAWRLEGLRSAPEWIQKKDQWLKRPSPEFNKLVFYFTVACAAAVVGLLVMIF